MRILFYLILFAFNFLFNPISAESKQDFPGVVIIKSSYSCWYYVNPNGKRTIVGADTTIVKFYASPKKENPLETIKLYFRDTSLDTLYGRKTVGRCRVHEGFISDSTSWLIPMTATDDSDRIVLTCKTKRGNWYEVVVNEQTRKTLWVHKNRFTHFYPWKDLPKHIFWLAFASQHNPNIDIFTKKDTASQKITHEFYCLQVESFEGSWMKVNNTETDLCLLYDPSKGVNGWVLFRDEKGLKVRLFIK